MEDKGFFFPKILHSWIQRVSSGSTIILYWIWTNIVLWGSPMLLFNYLAQHTLCLHCMWFISLKIWKKKSRNKPWNKSRRSHAANKPSDIHPFFLHLPQIVWMNKATAEAKTEKKILNLTVKQLKQKHFKNVIVQCFFQQIFFCKYYQVTIMNYFLSDLGFTILLIRTNLN